jgi:16S rRNA (guanine(966)-N(2))-methyltransferase RsmD
MRIIAGTKRGMKLMPPRGMDTRPITDRAKESLFSVLYKYDVIEGGVVGDLFSGTGSMGLEALSRGAGWATFVDMGSRVIPILERNIEKAGFVQQSRVIRANAFKTGAPVPSGCPDQPMYSAVFVDPPYKLSADSGQGSQVGRLLMILNEQVRPGGIVVLRTHKAVDPEPEYGQLKVIDRRTWGNMACALLQMNEDHSADNGGQE